jgi:hypothetical protein
MMYILFAFSFSLFIGSIIMLVLNLIFYGNSMATLILAASSSFNFATLSTAYKKETIAALKRIFWR